MRGLLSRAAVVAVLALACAAAPRPAAAWGADGHRVTGEIAWRLAAPETRAALRPLLPRGRWDTLAQAATWADASARDQPRYAWLEPLHYVNVDPRAARVTVGRDCGCVVGAIEIQRDRLADPETPGGERIEALRLLAHFVGDVHQPLHVSHPDGRGGTTVDVHHEGRTDTLHAVWDTQVLRRTLRARGRVRGPRWRAHAQSLADRLPAETRRRWAMSSDPRTWAEESLALARDPRFAARDGARLDDAWFDAARPHVDLRLAQAGVRLAAVLDAVFAR